MNSHGNAYSGKAIAIVGQHYCGSTILSLVLGSHPAIHGAGELFYFFYKPETLRPFCHVCGESCEYWTPALLAAVTQAGRGRLYDNVAAIFKKPIVCDASKHLGHFLDVMGEDTRSELLFVVLTKHPIRHVASFVTHDLFTRYRVRSKADVHQAWAQRHEEIMAFAVQTVRNIRGIYTAVQRRCAEVCGRGSTVRMAYELLVEDPPRALQPIMEFAGTDSCPEMLDYISHEHHPIGMSTGLRMQIRKRRGLSDPAWNHTDYCNDYYVKTQTLRMDDKYRQSFSPRQIEMLIESPEVQELCELLGYDPDPQRGSPGIQPLRHTP